MLGVGRPLASLGTSLGLAAYPNLVVSETLNMTHASSLRTRTLAPLAMTAALFAFASVGTGCGSKASTDEALERLNSPTGTFSKGNGSAAVSGYSNDNSSSNSFQGAGGLSGKSISGLALRNAVLGTGGRGTVTTQALSILAGEARTTSDCTADDDSVSCKCTGGGDFELEAERDGDDIRASGSYNNCKMGDTTFDGDMAFLMSKRVLLPAKKLTGSAGGIGLGYNVVFNMSGKVTTPRQSADVDIAFLLQHGAVWLSVKVNDGSISMGAGGNTIEVKTKSGTVTCTSTAGSYTCEAESGDKFDFTSEVKIGG